MGDRVLVLLQGDPSRGIVVAGLWGPDGPPDPGFDGGRVRRGSLRTAGGLRLDLSRRDLARPFAERAQQIHGKGARRDDDAGGGENAARGFHSRDAMALDQNPLHRRLEYKIRAAAARVAISELMRAEPAVTRAKNHTMRRYRARRCESCMGPPWSEMGHSGALKTGDVVPDST